MVIYSSNEKKALALAAKVQSNTLQDYNYYKSLDKKHQKTMKKDMASQPYYYSMIAKSIADAYSRNGEKEKGLKYLLNALKPVDSEFSLSGTTSEYQSRIQTEKSGPGTGNHSFL
jgi:hypothetical protein